MKLKLEIQKGIYGICRLPREAPIPNWADGNFVSITRTDDELSLVCEEGNIPEGIKCEKDWKIMKVAGPLDFTLVGVLFSLIAPLVEAGISIFAISTFDTDYLLVKNKDLEKATQALATSHHTVIRKSL